MPSDRFGGRFETLYDLLHLHKLVPEPIEPMPSEVSRNNPLSVYCPTVALMALVQAARDAILENAESVELSQESMEALLGQREAMLRWLEQRSSEDVYISLYVASEYSEDELIVIR